MINSTFLVVALTLQTRSAYREPGPGSLERIAQGDFIAIVRYVGHDPEEGPRFPRDHQPAAALTSDQYVVLASNQPGSPSTIHCLTRRASRKGTARLISDFLKKPQSPPDRSMTFLLVGRRAVDGTLRGGDFDPNRPPMAPNATIRARNDEVAVESLEPTSATALSIGNSPAEIYINTRLESLNKADAHTGVTDARFIFRAVRELQMVGRDDIAPTKYPEIAKIIETTAERRFPIAGSADERIFLAATLAELNAPARQRIRGQALEGAVMSQETVTGAITETWDAHWREGSISQDRVFVLASQAKNPSLRGLIVRQAQKMPTTSNGWSALSALLREEKGESLYLLLDFVARKTGRNDLLPPSLADGEAPKTMAKLSEFWRGQSLDSIRSPAFNSMKPN